MCDGRTESVAQPARVWYNGAVFVLHVIVIEGSMDSLQIRRRFVSCFQRAWLVPAPSCPRTSLLNTVASVRIVSWACEFLLCTGVSLARFRPACLFIAAST